MNRDYIANAKANKNNVFLVVECFVLKFKKEIWSKVNMLVWVTIYILKNVAENLRFSKFS